MAALKRIIRYIQGTKDHGLHLYPSSTLSLISYTDADWGGGGGGAPIHGVRPQAIVFIWGII